MSPARLAALAGLALVAIAGAFWLSAQRSLPRDNGVGEALLPGLRSQLNSVRQLRIRSGEDSTTLEREADTWSVRERGGYPANVAEVRRLLFSLADASTIEAKTSDPARYANLGLTDPGETPGGEGIVIELDGLSAPVRVIAGKPGPVSPSTYVRRGDESRSWLVDAALRPTARPRSWLNTGLVEIAADRIRSVTITDQSGRTYGVRKQVAEDRAFDVEGLQSGEQLSSPAVLLPVSTALSNLRMVDVATDPGNEDSWPERVRYDTFDGLVVEVEGRRTETGRFIRLKSQIESEPQERPAHAAASHSAAAPPQASTAVSESAAINRRVQGWTYEVATHVYDLLFPRLETWLTNPDHRD